MHFYLFDWCYWANTFLLIGTYLYPQSERLYILNFFTANGNLLWATMLFFNAFAPQSSMHMGGLALHVVPSMVSYCAHHRMVRVGDLSWGYPDMSHVKFDWSSFQYYMMSPVWGMALYTVVYGFMHFVVWKERIEKGNYMNTYKLALKSPFFKKLMFCLGPKMDKVMFFVPYWFDFMFWGANSFLCFHSEAYHLLFFLFVNITQFYNGGKYYMYNFSKRYIRESYNLDDPEKSELNKDTSDVFIGGETKAD